MRTFTNGGSGRGSNDPRRGQLTHLGRRAAGEIISLLVGSGVNELRNADSLAACVSYVGEAHSRLQCNVLHKRGTDFGGC